jgi:hypothetical protein
MVPMKQFNVVVVNVIVAVEYGHVLIDNVVQHVRRRVIHIIQHLMVFVIHIKEIVNMS